MTPEVAFESKGRNPQNGLWVHDWYSVGSSFSPIPIKIEDKVIFGLRTISVIDAASYFTMHFEHLKDVPCPVTSSQVIRLLEETFVKFRPPRVGCVISHSAWLSSHELLLDEDTASRGHFLSQHGIEFGPMSIQDKEKIVLWGKSFNFAIEFNADNIGNYKR